MRSGSDDSTKTAVLEAYGAQLAVTAPDGELLRRIIEGLPRGWVVTQDTDADKVAWRFAVSTAPDGYRIRDGDGLETPCSDLELAVWMLRTRMRRFVGHHARDHIFVHAGVVSHRGKAILLPGHSFAGKSTLVAALVRAGADYFSDEYAMLDRAGLVAQYLEPLSMRGEAGREVLALGADNARDPVPVGLVALTVYRPGGNWSPQRLSLGAGVVAVMEHAVPARDRPAETLAALRFALADATVLEGERGEADETARALLETVDSL